MLLCAFISFQVPLHVDVYLWWLFLGKASAASQLAMYVDACPRCKSGTMIRILAFDAHAPPLDMLQKTDITIKMKKTV
jgi:hypothetical protein